jgi:hypothetical protein
MPKEKKEKKVDTHIGGVNYTTQKLSNGEGPYTSKIHPTIPVLRRQYNEPAMKGVIRAGLLKTGAPSRKATHQMNSKEYVPYKGHHTDNIFAGRFNKKGVDLHAHTFAISHNKNSVRHFQESKIRNYKMPTYQPSITQEQYNNKAINYEPSVYNNQELYIVNQPVEIENLGQGPLL